MINARPIAKSKNHDDAIASMKALVATWTSQGWTKTSDINGTMSSSPARGVEWKFSCTMTRDE